jgi:hypothetical protein
VASRARPVPHVTPAGQSWEGQPLVLAFQGAGLSGPQFRSFFNLVTPVGAAGIVVYPTGLGGQWDVRRDLPFIDALITQLSSSYCIDAHASSRPATATGGSSRTRSVASALTCCAPSGRCPADSSSTRPCKGDLAVWISHGAADNLVMTSDGRHTRAFWVRRNQCNAMTRLHVHLAAS